VGKHNLVKVKDLAKAQELVGERWRFEKAFGMGISGHSPIEQEMQFARCQRVSVNVKLAEEN